MAMCFNPVLLGIQSRSMRRESVTVLTRDRTAPLDLAALRFFGVTADVTERHYQRAENVESVRTPPFP